MGTSQAPTAGVAVLRRFSCLSRKKKKKELGIHIQQQQLARLSNAIMNDIQIGGIWQNNVTK